MAVIGNEIGADRFFLDPARRLGLGVVGMSHRSASLEQIGHCPLRAQEAAGIFCADLFDEYVVLATCNRIEVYFRSARSGPRRAAEIFLSRVHEAAPHDGVGVFYRRTGAAAARHLLAVASGIDSLIVGETEILSQVRAAGRRAADAGTCGPFLERLFRDAWAFGRDVRRRIPISEGMASAADLAVSEASAGGSLGVTEVLLCGAGDISRKVGILLMKKDPPKTTYLLGRSASGCRTLKDALLAVRPGADVRIVPAATLRRVLGRVGVVLSATSAESYVLQANDIPASRTDLLLIDLGVPADIDPDARDIGRRIRRVTMEDFRPIIAATLRSRKQLVMDVRRAIAAAIAAEKIRP